SARPGNTVFHHAVVTTSRPSAIMPPSVGVGGGTPTPKKSSVEALMMTPPISRAAIGIATPITLGRTLRQRILIELTPMVSAARTKGSRRSRLTSGVTTRAYDNHVVRPNTMITLTRLA